MDTETNRKFSPRICIEMVAKSQKNESRSCLSTNIGDVSTPKYNHPLLPRSQSGASTTMTGTVFSSLFGPRPFESAMFPVYERKNLRSVIIFL